MDNQKKMDLIQRVIQHIPKLVKYLEMYVEHKQKEKAKDELGQIERSVKELEKSLSNISHPTQLKQLAKDQVRALEHLRSAAEDFYRHQNDENRLPKDERVMETDVNQLISLLPSK